MVLIREEAFVYILIICIRLNRKDHLQLTNGERSFLGRAWGHSGSAGARCQRRAQPRGSQSTPNSWRWVPHFLHFLKVLAVPWTTMKWLLCENDHMSLLLGSKWGWLWDLPIAGLAPLSCGGYLTPWCLCRDPHPRLVSLALSGGTFSRSQNNRACYF